MSNVYHKEKPTEPRPGTPKCADCDDTGNYYNIGLECHCKIEGTPSMTYSVGEVIASAVTVIARQDSDSFDHFCSNAELLKAIEHLRAARTHIEEALKPQDPDNY